MADKWLITLFSDAPVQVIDGDRGKHYPKLSEFHESEYCLFLNAGNVTADGFAFSKCAFISADKDALLGKGKLNRYDSVLTTRGTVGNVAFYDSSVPYERVRINSGMVILRPDTHQIFPRFLYIYLRSPSFKSQVTAFFTGSAQPQLPIRDIMRLRLPIPPLPEQRAIAAILGALDDKIELNRQMNQTLEAMAQALFKSWFVDFAPFRDQGTEESPLGPIPKGWRVEEVGKEVKVLGGSTPSTKEPKYWQGGEHCWATPKDLSTLNSPILLNTERRITDAGLKTISSGLLPADVVLLSSRAPIGYVAISIVPVAINQGFIAMVCDQQLSNYYTLLWANYNLDDIKARANGTTFLEISKSSFRPMPVIVPTIEVMNQFKETVEPIFMRITNNEKESRTLAAIRDTLLPKLLSGEIRVKNAEKFVEEKI